MKADAASMRFTTPDKLEIRQGGGCISLFGIPFFGAGIFMLLSVAQVIPFSNASEIPFYGWLIMLGMGLVFSAVGAAMVFGRSWIVVDRVQKRIWTAKGLLRPMWGQNYELAVYTTIVLNVEKGDSDTSDRYAVSLRNDRAGGDIELWSSTCYGDARKQAELLIEFLKLPLEDISTGQKTLVKTEEYIEGKSIFKYNRPAVIHVPQKLRSDVSQVDDTLQIKIMGRRFGMLNLVEIVIPLLIFIFLHRNIIPFFRVTNTPIMVGTIFGGFITLFFVIFPLIGILRSFIRSITVNTVVRVSPEVLAIQVFSGINKGKVSISKDSIVGFDYHLSEREQPTQASSLLSGGITSGQQYPQYDPPQWLLKLERKSTSKGVFIKSREGLYQFGEGLTHDEVKYLYSVVMEYVCEYWQDKTNEGS